VLLAVIQINKNPRFINSRGALKLLNADLDSYKDITDPATTFPLTGTTAENKTAASKRLAAILSKMIEDFTLMSTLSVEDNKIRQNAAIASYKQDFPDRSNVPLLSASRCSGPTLGPLDDEHGLEAYNRCLMLTKYFKYCQQLTLKTFEIRFPLDGDIKGAKVLPSMIPAWMRPKAQTSDPKPARSEAMLRLDGLSKKTFTLRHAPRLDDRDSKDDLEGNFEKALADGIESLSTTRQDFWIDPRLYDSLTSLRDQIRRQVRCPQFRTDLARVVVRYKQKDAYGILDLRANLLNDDWAAVKSILHNESNDDFDFQIGLRARSYESTDSISEEPDVPPHLKAYFKPFALWSSRDPLFLPPHFLRL
jgi:hypothetical protein